MRSLDEDDLSDIRPEDDPIDHFPDSVKRKIEIKTSLLSEWLETRQKHYANVMREASSDGTVADSDASTMALIERLAVYETMMDALIIQGNDHSERLGGRRGEN